MLKNKFLKATKTMLLKHTSMRKSRANIVAQLVEGLISYGTVMHKELAYALQRGKTLNESGTRRVERFFSDATISEYECFKMVWKQLSAKGKVVLAMDRSNWQRGSKPINICVVTCIWENSAVPIAWEALPKTGNTNTSERKRLMKKVLSVVGTDNIDALLADREFIGEEWFSFLLSSEIPFIIRVKENLYVRRSDGTRAQISTIMKNLKNGEVREEKVFLGEVPVRLVATTSPGGSLVAVAASMQVIDDVLTQYRKRWLIELFFKSIKSKGFNFERTHMTDPERISKLFLIVAIACLLIVKAGSTKNLFKKIRTKKHGRRVVSLFTYGFEFLRSVFARKSSFDNGPPFYTEVLDSMFHKNSEDTLEIG